MAEVAKALATGYAYSSLTCFVRRAGKVCVCELVPLFGISQPTLSHHLRSSRRCLVDSSARAYGPTTTSSPT